MSDNASIINNPGANSSGGVKIEKEKLLSFIMRSSGMKTEGDSILYASICRNKTLLADVNVHPSEEVRSTAQALLEREATVGFDALSVRRSSIKGLRFHVYELINGDEPLIWVFFCVYNSSRINKQQAQIFLQKTVSVTELQRYCDEAWREGEYRACRDSFSPVLLELMQEFSSGGNKGAGENLELSKRIIRKNREVINEFDRRKSKKEAENKEQEKALLDAAVEASPLTPRNLRSISQKSTGSMEDALKELEQEVGTCSASLLKDFDLDTSTSTATTFLSDLSGSSFDSIPLTPSPVRTGPERGKAAASNLNVIQDGSDSDQEEAVRAIQSTTVNAIVVIQRLARGCLCRKKILLQSNSARCIQQNYRGFHERRSYVHKLRAAVVVQAALRGHLARQSLSVNDKAARRIQSHWRRAIDRRNGSSAKTTSPSKPKDEDVITSKDPIADFQLLIQETRAEEWQKRTKAFASLVDSIPQEEDSADSDAWYKNPPMLRQLAVPISELLKDGRSGVVKRTCESLTRLFALCQSDARYLFKDLMPTILSVNAQTVQVSRQAVQNMVMESIPQVPCKMVMPLWMERLKTDKSRTVREACVLYLGQALKSWTEEGYLTQQIWLQVGSTLLLSLKDTSSKVRSHAKEALEHMQQTQPEYWALLLKDNPVEDAKLQQWLKSLGSPSSNLDQASSGTKHKEAASEAGQDKAAMILQSYWRGVADRGKYATAVESASLQQSSALCIQRHYRGYREHHRFSDQVRAIVLAQAAARRHLVRQRAQVNEKVARQIQTWWKGAIEHRKYAAATESLRLQQSSAVCIQRHYRGYRERHHSSDQIRSIVLAQAAARSHLVRQSTHVNEKAARQIQTWWKGAIERRKYAFAVESLRMQQSSAVCIQKQYRGYRERRSSSDQIRSIVLAQAAARSHLVRQRAHVNEGAAELIQSHWRGSIERRRFADVVDSVVLIQRWLARNRACSENPISMEAGPALSIQKCYRGHRERRSYIRKLRSAVLVQAALRGHGVRQRARTDDEAAQLIQSQWRGYMDRRAYSARRGASIRIQALARSYRAKSQYARTIRSIVLIQSIMRAYLCWKHALLAKLYIMSGSSDLVEQVKGQPVSRTSLHRFWRGIAGQRRQSATEATSAEDQNTNQDSAREALLLSSAVRIQRSYRGCRERHSHSQQLRSVVLIQTAVRSHLARQREKASRDIQSDSKDIVELPADTSTMQFTLKPSDDSTNLPKAREASSSGAKKFFCCPVFG